jgi:hypothetical protein
LQSGSYVLRPENILEFKCAMMEMYVKRQCCGAVPAGCNIIKVAHF